MKNQKSSKSESHVMSLRMDNEMYKELDELSKKYEVNKSQILKQAFEEWDSIKKHALEENLIIVGRPFLGKLLTHIEPQQIEELSKFTAKNLGAKIRFQLIDKDVNIEITRFLDFFIEGSGKKSFAWFNNISYKFTEDEDVILFGNHSVNHNFSLYVKGLLKHLILDLFDYQLREEDCRISTNTIHLFFEKL
ncbi:MAG: ribbon-helix-helix protein, CopG family [Candidatus Lokiarchaeota archaeon]|nr:ribbon-helix-helix protein, CopG family [Candidatus Lokiarchaeota archaeon]MBD3201485.1 ribbon-helix-helix protein, CopG family [Candidatus Lokiarchaeota archaeon]